MFIVCREEEEKKPTSMIADFFKNATLNTEHLNNGEKKWSHKKGYICY